MGRRLLNPWKILTIYSKHLTFCCKGCNLRAYSALFIMVSYHISRYPQITTIQFDDFPIFPALTSIEFGDFPWLKISALSRPSSGDEESLRLLYVHGPWSFFGLLHRALWCLEQRNGDLWAGLRQAILRPSPWTAVGAGTIVVWQKHQNMMELSKDNGDLYKFIWCETSFMWI